MPRIRTIKPELPADEGLARCSRDARLLFMLLITQADDEGRMRGSPAFVRSACLPYDDVTLQQIDGWLDELHVAGKIQRYAAAAESYLALTSWSKHQRIDRATRSQIPRPSRTFDERSSKARRTFDERSTMDLEGDQEKEQEQPPVALAARREAKAGGPVEQVFGAWVQSTGRDRTQLDDKRRRLIRAALASYPIEDVLAAVDGWRHSAHHRGENDRHTVYNDLGLLLRNGEMIERFRDYTLGRLDAQPAGDTRQAQILAGLQQSRTTAPRQIGKG